MVLVDTSVWIRFLANRMPYAAELDRLLESQLLHSYDLMHRVRAVDHTEVAAFVRSHRLHGRGIGWIDAHLLASALVGETWLWTADEHLAKVAGELGIAYRGYPG